MNDYIIKRRIDSPLTTGLVLTVLAFVAAMIFWPLWALMVKAVASNLAAVGLKAVDAKTVTKYFTVFTETTFLWLFVCPWMWQTLGFGNYGKTYLTNKQPGAGLWYLLVSLIAGSVGFLIIIGFIGLWWQPFNFSVLFSPKTAAEVHLAIEGLEVASFFVLAVLLALISYVALFHKWPFAGNIKAPWDGFGALMTSTTFALLVWIAVIIPSLMPNLSIGNHVIVAKPFGSWPAFLAFCQAFIFVFLMPAEGGEKYPMQLFAKKQPWMGLVGLAIALLAGLVIPPVLRTIIAPLNLLPGAPVDLVVASLELSVVFVLLTWHHLFDDYPSAAIVPNTLYRILIRLAIWLTVGTVFGVIWLKTFKMLSFGANDLGIGLPTLGILCGQFCPLIMILYINTFFDKWPVVYKESAVKVPEGVANVAEAPQKA